MKKYKRGYASGVFDMFHIGHLKILQQAKEMCDFLVVGVNTDDLVFIRKNKHPVIPYGERTDIVRAIRYVDLVVEAGIPEHQYVNAIKYDCNAVFDGDDWKGTEKMNILEERLKPHGVEIVYFPYTKDISSTILRDKSSDAADES